MLVCPAEPGLVVVVEPRLATPLEGDPPQAASDTATTNSTTNRELAARHHRTVRLLPSSSWPVDIVRPLPFNVVATPTKGNYSGVGNRPITGDLSMYPGANVPTNTRPLEGACCEAKDPKSCSFLCGSAPQAPWRDTRQVTKATTPPAAVLAVLAALSFLVTACGGGPVHSGVASLPNPKTTTTEPSAAPGSSSSGQSGPTEAQLLKYADCIRSHGEPNFPDPGPARGGGFAFGVTPGLNPRSSPPQFQKAEKDCQKDVPPSLANSTPAQMAANALKYTDCMRSHGEPNFPDPNGEGMITIDPSGILDPNSSQFQKAENECQGQNNGDFDEQFTSSPGG